ncbi:hypothetical protein [Bacillus pseudomycoides]|uniref:hypothetical protein n=1 Tax=Bacillus pseudomycoides TaxID=64104 RepID=UPI000BEB629D|nr:hypothetical protein [Bacillus pseudomycoides]PED08590.1 hypothetical protein COO19_09140 [Bacillus pseudomycoides]PEI90591.1 hypothetical protein CN686_23840 [Bacillus pseudomycoides]PEK27287.1 hypothetical protein CN693_07820 [Bacillus pseudomycoides]PEM78648.1 hypothetical protein CN619_02500 [Bacillus pseudomycoides]PEO20744.1 hypothetical protein CN542_12490 [Bacillus pseudomycoides]
MNWAVLKDFKTILGFTIAILFAIISVVLAVKEIGYWVVFIVLTTILTSLSVNRADKIYKSRS